MKKLILFGPLSLLGPRQLLYGFAGLIIGHQIWFHLISYGSSSTLAAIVGAVAGVSYATKSANRQTISAEAKARSMSTMNVFGVNRDRPRFLDNAPGLFDRNMPSFAYYKGKKGLLMAGIPPLTRSVLNERRMLESMYVSARNDMYRRGIPVRDNLGKMCGPRITDYGLVLETTENEDGSRTELVAVGLGNSLSKQDWLTAFNNEMDSGGLAWDEKPLALLDSWGSDAKRMTFDNPRSSVLPLYYLALAERRLPATTAAKSKAAEGKIQPDMPDTWQ